MFVEKHHGLQHVGAEAKDLEYHLRLHRQPNYGRSLGERKSAEEVSTLEQGWSRWRNGKTFSDDVGMMLKLTIGGCHGLHERPD